jgi:hypothetical protein
VFWSVEVNSKTFLMAAALATASSVAVTSTAMAAPSGPGWEFTTPGNDFSNGTWDFASAFTVSTSATVTGLGYYASPYNGQVASNPVALYQCADVDCDSTATEIASATVTNIYPLNGHFRYVTITPVTLMPGVGYEVAGVSNGDNYTWADTGFATNSAVALTSISGGTTRWQALGTPDFLNYTNTGEIEPDGFWGPDIYLGASSGFTGVPEPATWGLMLIGAFGVGAGLRARKSRALAPSARLA